MIVLQVYEDVEDHVLLHLDGLVHKKLKNQSYPLLQHSEMKNGLNGFIARNSNINNGDYTTL